MPPSLISIGIILAAGLRFLGLGVTPPSAEWGLMLNNLRQALWVDPVIAALPGVMIFITSMCFNLLSDGLRASHGRAAVSGSHVASAHRLERADQAFPGARRTA